MKIRLRSCVINSIVLNVYRKIWNSFEELTLLLSWYVIEENQEVHHTNANTDIENNVFYQKKKGKKLPGTSSITI